MPSQCLKISYLHVSMNFIQEKWKCSFRSWDLLNRKYLFYIFICMIFPSTIPIQTRIKSLRIFDHQLHHQIFIRDLITCIMKMQFQLLIISKLKFIKNYIKTLYVFYIIYCNMHVKSINKLFLQGTIRMFSIRSRQKCYINLS